MLARPPESPGKWSGVVFAVVGGIVGSIFVAAAKDRTGSFSRALPLVAAMLLVAAILPAVTRKPGRRRERRLSRGPSGG